ncbi:hypothetical protein ABZ383_23250 [Streptomyces sp. NPDC005900]|uniref:hypothetical protein n=1 Tax=Streptomyces sp. NPDC005900 TaxID=3154569 RepID=UPI0033F8B777
MPTGDARTGPGLSRASLSGWYFSRPSRRHTLLAAPDGAAVIRSSSVTITGTA